MSSRLFLHIGSPKTGTTFLQQVLWSQREEVKEQGLLLPGGTFNDHFLACMDVRSRHARVPESVGAWDRIVELSARWDGDALISHELFAGARIRPVTKIVTDLSAACDELHVVITVRDLARQIPAEWQEHLKHRSTLAFEDFVRSLRERGKESQWFWRVQDFPAVAERWAEHVPAGRVHVVTVPPAGAGPEVLWSRFAETVGLAPDGFSLDVRRSNTSVGLEQAELIRRLNLALGDRLDRQGAYSVLVKDGLVHETLARRPGTKLSLTRSDWDFAVEHAEGMARDLDALGVHVVGDVKDLVPQGDAPTVTSPPEADVERVLEEGVAALAAALDAHDRTRQRLQRARARMDPPPPDPAAHPVRRALVAASRRWSWADRAKQAYKRRTGRGAAGDGDGE